MTKKQKLQIRLILKALLDARNNSAFIAVMIDTGLNPNDFKKLLKNL